MGTLFSSEEPLPVKNPQEAFNEYHVFDHALRCRTGYETPSIIVSEQVKWIFNQSDVQGIYIDEAEVTCIIENHENMQWLTVVGARNIETHLASYDMEWSDLDCASIHHGFLRLANIVWQSIFEILEKNKSKPIRLSGHSIGAAIVAIFAMRLANHDFKVEEIVTFSQPKITDEEGIADTFNRKLSDCKYLRVGNDGDPCFLLPPESVGFTSCLSARIYKHYGPELIFFKENNRGMSFFYEHQADEDKAKEIWSEMSWKILEAEPFFGIKGYLSAILFYGPSSLSQQAKILFRI
jgi:hypothetical protein